MAAFRSFETSWTTVSTHTWSLSASSAGVPSMMVASAAGRRSAIAW
ncbi:MAG TPA: hypothetical protein VJ622_07650 [Acidimicrobiia bacterium]|nr:hypothetical protein [Acidimicrobiia bacterium]